MKLDSDSHERIGSLALVRAAHSYLVCGTPRTGSTLLCSLLSSTGVAGRPESYFREPDQQRWASRFGLPTDERDDVDFDDFLRGAVRAGSTGNGVFAARIMWGTVHLLVEGLSRGVDERSDVDVLENALGPLRFVHLRRLDVVAQAVSWARAEQTEYWQQGDKVNGGVELDLDQVDRLVAAINEHNDAWRTWFAAQAVEPLTLTYESLVSDPRAATTRVLAFIGAVPPSAWRPVSPHKRQADSINAEWVRRYRGTRA